MTETDIFDRITADTPEGEAFAELLREEAVSIELVNSVESGEQQGGDNDD